MKYSCSTIINAPIDAVVALWDNPEHFNQWQDGFQSITLLQGSNNSPGAKSKIVLEDKMRIELTETIITYNLPKEKKALYEHKHMSNTQTSNFESIDVHKTRYTSEVEYTQFNGFMIKLMAILFPGKFKAQSEKWMQQFKAFAEKTIS